MISQSADDKFLKNLLGNAEDVSTKMEPANSDNELGSSTESKSDRTSDVTDKGSVLLPRIDLSAKNSKHQGSEKVGKNLNPKAKKALKIAGLGFLIFFVFLSIVGFLTYGVYKKGLALKESVNALVASGKSQDLAAVRSELDNTKNSLNSFKSSYNTLLWLKVIPFAGSYVADGQHGVNAAGYAIEAAQITLTAVEPYSDIIGFNGGKQSENGQETAKDRLDFVVKTIPNLLPDVDNLIIKVKLAREELDQIDPNRYPETLRGMKVREKIKQGIELVDTGADVLVQSKPLLENSNYLMGVDSTRRYLVLFQNDKELRPTGGFLTAYSISKVDSGRFEPVSSNDIYNLDAQYTPSIPAPEPLIKYIKGPYVISRNFRLRDINWSPDFAVSMKLFSEEAEKAGLSGVDGIIAVDTQVLVNLLDVLGPIGVPGYGDYSTKIDPQCNCPQVIYELESFADVEGPIVWDPVSGKIVFAPANIDNRKKIIGPLMNSILANALGQPKDKVPALFEAMFKSVSEKHVLLYMFDSEVQQAVTDVGFGGTIKDYAGDYLHVNDANLGGRKSNLYVTQQVSQDVRVERDGSVEETVTVTYTNPEKQDGWLNSVLPNWVRVYVPKGATLVSMEGFEDKVEPYDELNKTVFAGFFNLRPEGVAKVTVTYKLPFKVQNGQYQGFIQKQPGKDAPLYSVKVNNRTNEFYLKTDKEIRLKI